MRHVWRRRRESRRHDHAACSPLLLARCLRVPGCLQREDGSALSEEGPRRQASNSFARCTRSCARLGSRSGGLATYCARLRQRRSSSRVRGELRLHRNDKLGVRYETLAEEAWAGATVVMLMVAARASDTFDTPCKNCKSFVFSSVLLRLFSSSSSLLRDAQSYAAVNST
jgi:hypothetical protein